MQLCCELKGQHTYRLLKCYQLGAMLLVVLFLSISVVQAFHSHTKAVQTERTDDNNDSISDSDQCKLCDYLTHKQGNNLFMSHVPVVVLSLPQPISYQTEQFIGNYKFTLQGFTNKGPPALIA